MNSMTHRTSLLLLIATIVVVGACRSPQARTEIEPPPRPKPINCTNLLFVGGTPAIYPSDAKPGFNSPEEVTAFLEKRWSLADVRKFAIPERRHNDAYQNLVTVGFSETWAGRLYCDKTTGFDSIEWYATVENDRVKDYSLNAIRGQDSWLLEIGGPGPDSVQSPPDVEPDFRKPYFVGHK